MPQILQISERQYEALRRKSLDDANDRMVEYARERFPEEFGAAPKSSIVELIERVRSQAAEFSIEYEDEVAGYLDIAVLLGEGFFRDEWSFETLSSSELTASQKLELLHDDARLSGVEL